MPPPTCPQCDSLLPTAALADRRCPACGKRLPEAIGSKGNSEGSWFTLILLILVGLTAGLTFGMARHGVLNGPWAIVPLLIFAALAVARVFELRRNRRRRAAESEREES